MNNFFRFIMIPILTLFTLALMSTPLLALFARKSRYVMVPTVVGMARQDAMERLMSEGFESVEIREETDDRSKINKVLYTNPPSRETARRGSSVTIYVGQPRLIVVPNVVGKSQEDARRFLESVGFKVIAQEEVTDDRAQVNKVIHLSAAPGSKVDPNSSILIYVGRAKQIVTPFSADFSDQSFYVGPTKNEVKKFSELPYWGMEFEVPKGSKEPLVIGVGTSWKINGGKLAEVSVSFDGGGTWNSLPEMNSPVQINTQIYPPLGAKRFVFRMAGHDTDEQRNRVGDIKFITDSLSGRVVVREKAPILITPFSATFTNQRLRIGDKTVKFSEIPEAGLNYYSDQPIRIRLETDWQVGDDSGARHWLSKDGGKRKESLLHPMVGGGDYEFVALPRETFDFVWGVDGFDVDNIGHRVGADKTIVDPVHAQCSVVGTTFDATFSNETVNIYFSSAGVDIPYLNKKFSEIPPSGLDVNVPTEADRLGYELWVLADIDVSWQIKGGWPSSIDMSLNGGDNWTQLQYLFGNVGLHSHQFKRMTLKGHAFLDPPFDKSDIVLRLTGLDGEKEGSLPTGGFKYITGPMHGKINIKKGVKVETVTPKGALEDAGKVLLEMARAYENKDLSGFMSRVSEDFPNRGELETFARRDFKDYSSVKITLFPGRVVNIPNGKSVEADWEMQFFPTARSKQIRIGGQGTEFVFMNQEGALKLQKMRGANPLFGARSHDVAALSGASSSVVQLLQKIEDEGTSAAQQAALSLVGSTIKTGIEEVPVTFEIVEAFSNYTNGALEKVNFDSVQTGRPIKAKARIRIVDNPKNIDFTNLKLEVTDSLTGATVSVTGNIQANQEITFSVDTDIFFSPIIAGRSGTLTFVLDPTDKFVAIERAKKTVKINYTLI